MQNAPFVIEVGPIYKVQEIVIAITYFPCCLHFNVEVLPPGRRTRGPDCKVISMLPENDHVDERKKKRM